MKQMGMRVAAALAMGGISTVCMAQTEKQVKVFPASEISAQLTRLEQDALSNGSSGTKLADYGSNAIELSVRTKSGGAEIHAHFADIFFVTKGKATLVTGGTVVDAHTESNGETHGTRIEDGTSRMIGKGDVVEIPPGTPHQLSVAPGMTYSAIVIKVHER